MLFSEELLKIRFQLAVMSLELEGELLCCWNLRAAEGKSVTKKEIILQKAREQLERDGMRQAKRTSCTIVMDDDAWTL